MSKEPKCFNLFWGGVSETHYYTHILKTKHETRAFCVRCLQTIVIPTEEVTPDDR